MRKAKEPPRFLLILFFALFVFSILVITMLVVGITTYFLSGLKILGTPGLGTLLFTIALASIAVGTIVSFFVGKTSTRPVSELIYGMNSLAAGNYETRLSLGVPKLGRELEESFNIMAEELQNTEMLRSDFVNNFSHEFKTPLVSIQGFARLLQRENLSVQKQREYISIIASESARLADMATKVLDLTKLENQSILTDVSKYNLSEQMRESILLLERKWSEKELLISADFDEINIRGNQEMLKQVWINLLDNAIKFSTRGGEVKVDIFEETESITVSVSNEGNEIPEDERRRIFQKFYQCDTSHTLRGNGIGLAIVYRIVKLHAGDVWADSHDKKTIFMVKLPREQ